jgi:hypothetical protein
MTKAEIVQLITRRLGDSTSSYFGDRAWDYFEQELYAILQSGEGFTTDEIQGLQTKYSFPAQMSNDGIAILNLSVLPRLKQIDKIEVNGRLSDSIASEEYKKIIEHPFYQLSGNESKYYRIGNELRILSGIIGRSPLVDIWYYQTLADFADADEVNLGKGIVLNVANRVIPLLKAEIGMVVQ